MVFLTYIVIVFTRAPVDSRDIQSLIGLLSINKGLPLSFLCERQQLLKRYLSFEEMRSLIRFVGD